MKNEHEYTRLDDLQSTFSDMWKSAYGSRPRWPSSEQWNDVVWLEQQCIELGPILTQIYESEQKAERIAIEKFELRLKDVIESGAKDRETAIRWMFEAENDDYVWDDPNYYCYNHGLPYGYFKGVRIQKELSA